MRCPKCGLVNFKTETACKRCGAVLGDTPYQAANESCDAWQDSNLLVLRKDGHLPPQCVRCNSIDGVEQIKMSLGYYPKYNLALLLVGFVYYKTFKLEISLCERDKSSRRKSVIVAVLLLVGGIIAIVFSRNHSGFVLIGGLVMVAVGSILATIPGTPVSIEKVEKPYIWIKGVSRDYLAGLPQWSNSRGRKLRA